MLANTTVRREGLRVPANLRDQAGGLSGRPLLARTLEMIGSSAGRSATAWRSSLRAASAPEPMRRPPWRRARISCSYGPDSSIADQASSGRRSPPPREAVFRALIRCRRLAKGAGRTRHSTPESSPCVRAPPRLLLPRSLRRRRSSRSSPGPAREPSSSEIIDTVSPSLTRAYPLAAESGEGYVVVDVDGNRFLDFAAGIAVASTGHSHPAVVAAIAQQAERLIHIAATDFYEPRYVEFSERLARIAPFAEQARVFLTNSGTEAVEGAIKLARFHTGRAGIIAFEGGFHGRTMGALSLTNSKIRQRAGFGPLVPMVEHAPFPRVRTWREHSGGDGTAELDVLRHTILGRLMAPSDVAAIVVEPIQGEGGYFLGPPAFLAGLREICDEHGILLVADEIQSGTGAPVAGGRCSTRASSRTS